LNSSAGSPGHTPLTYFVAVAASSLVATIQLALSVRFKGSLVIHEEVVGWVLIFTMSSFICASIFGLLPIWIVRACARRFRWRQPWPFVVFGALGSLSTLLPFYVLDSYTMMRSSPITFAIPGAVGGLVYWLCVRRQLPPSPNISIS
jgi:hypothetical protein